jgi:DNA-binding NtrC family response regulator
MNDLSEKNTILFVDDEQVVLDVGTLMLDRLGYNVLQATDGMEARQIFTDNTDDICLVILDMLLPDENGSDVCKRLKQIKPDLKVLHTSGLGIAQGADSIECGCNGFLPKPFKIDEMSEKIQELLENTK